MSCDEDELNTTVPVPSLKVPLFDQSLPIVSWLLEFVKNSKVPPVITATSSSTTSVGVPELANSSSPPFWIVKELQTLESVINGITSDPERSGITTSWAAVGTTPKLQFPATSHLVSPVPCQVFVVWDLTTKNDKLKKQNDNIFFIW